MGLRDEVARKQKEKAEQELVRQQDLQAERERSEEKYQQAKIERKRGLEESARRYVEDVDGLVKILKALQDYGYTMDFFRGVAEITNCSSGYALYMRDHTSADGDFNERLSIDSLKEEYSETKRCWWDARKSLGHAVLAFGLPAAWHYRSTEVGKGEGYYGWLSLQDSNGDFFDDDIRVERFPFRNLHGRETGLAEPKKASIGVRFWKIKKNSPFDLAVYVRIYENSVTLTGASQWNVDLKDFEKFVDTLEEALKNPIKSHVVSYLPSPPDSRRSIGRNDGPCLPSSSLISTPEGERAIKELKEGDAVWTVDKTGNKTKAALAQVVRRPAAKNHVVAHVVLEDGRKLVVSHGHPTIDSREIGAMKKGDVLDGVRIRSLHIKPYTDQYTYDILPEGDTGGYWADGILIGSTLSSHFLGKA